MAHIRHMGGVEPRNVKRAQRTTYSKHTAHIRHLRSVKSRNVKRAQRTTSSKHTAHVGHFRSIEIVQPTYFRHS